MRTAYHNKSIVTNENGFVGVNLGADYCAEHEWGIKKLKAKFGITANESKYGFDRMVITKFPEVIFDDKNLMIFCDDLSYFDKDRKAEIIRDKTKAAKQMLKSHVEYGREEDAKIYSEWDEGSFMVIFDKSLSVQYLELKKAFDDLNLIITLGRSGPFSNGGLILGIRDRISQEDNQELVEAQKSQERLQEFAENTGIHNELKEAGRRYFALSPRWKDEAEDSVVFWLNPMEQDKNNFGWYSVEDLRLWVEGKGPIPK